MNRALADCEQSKKDIEGKNATEVFAFEVIFGPTLESVAKERKIDFVKIGNITVFGK